MLGSVLLLCVVAILGWAVFMYVLKTSFSFSFIGTPLQTFGYFLLLTLLILFLFPFYTAPLFYGTAYSLLFAALVLGFINPWLYRFIRQEYGSRRTTTEAHPDLELLRLEPVFLFSKLGDVVFQQAAVGTLILMLADTPLPLYLLGALCAGIFCLGHLGLFFRIPREWAFYFLGSALVAGFSLPFLYTSMEGAFYYAASLHMLWYAATGAFYVGGKHKHAKRRRT